MQELSKSERFFRRKSDPVNFLSAGLGAKLVAADQQGAGPSYEHPAILAPDHLGRPSFATCHARAAARRRRQKSPYKTNREVR